MQACRYLLLYIAISMAVHSLYAQAPTIDQIIPQKATVEEIISISGSGFGSNPAQLSVIFGAASGEITRLTDTLLEVKVPPGATTGSIAVVRLDSRLTAYSPQMFFLSFDGEGFETSQLDGPHSFTTSAPNLYNLCMCDFNRDGKVDIATSDTGSDQISVLENSSVDLDAVSFVKREFDINARTRWVRCADLNGDGFPELLFSASNSDANKERVYIYKNTSTAGGAISFEIPNPPLAYTLDGTLAARMDVKDLDGDGKPELVAVAISSEGGVSVFKNTSSGGAISFENSPMLPFQNFNVSNVELSGVDLEDLDGDGKADIIASEDERSGLHIFRNASTNSSLAFDAYLPLNTSGQTTNMRAGDLTGDGKPEIVIVNGSYVGVFKNTSTAGSLSFASAVRFDQTLIDREGLELADMDGNGQLDIIFATTLNRIVVLMNNSSGGNLDFNTKKTIITNENTLSIRAGDLNGDGKPDLAYTETTSDVVTVQLNRNCVKPVLEPQNGLGVCDLLPYQLSVTKAIGVSYTWESSADGNSFAPLAVAVDSTFTFTTANEAYYRVKISSSHNGVICNEIVSNVVQVVRPDGFVPNKPTIIDKDPAEPVCFGDRITLRAQNVNARFFWSGPNGFTSSEQNPVISSATKANEGLYILYVKASEQDGSCVSDTATTFLRVSEPEQVSITSDDPLVLFNGGEASLQVDAVTGSSYSWKRNGQLVEGANGTTLTVRDAGSYTATIQNETGCTRQSTAVEIVFAQISIPGSQCLNEAIAVSVSPATLNGKDIRYRWNFGDESLPGTGNTLTHQYSQAGTYPISIEILNSDNSVRDVHQQEITIIDLPELTIAPQGNANLCPDEQVALQASEGFATYTWEHGASGAAITVTEAGTYMLNATTESGCTESASITIIDADNPDASIEAASDRISLGDTLQLRADGGVSYLWSPAESLNDITVANPIARPLITTTYTCVITNAEGCQATLTYTVNVDRSLDVAPQKAFTPNGDGRYDTWYIDRMDLYPDCRLTIFDRQGAKLLEIENYSNTSGWNGTINGNPLPNGVYYFLIDCGAEAGSSTGSVTILR